jgi:hypothetical protein
MTRSRARNSKTRFSSSPLLGSVLFSNQLFKSSSESLINLMALSLKSPYPTPRINDMFKDIPSFGSVSNCRYEHTLTIYTDPDQYTVIPATLKILKVLIVELQSAAGAARDLDAAVAAELAEEGSGDEEWEDESNPFADLGTGFSKEQLMAYAAEDGPNQSRQRDDETQGFLVDFFKRASATQGFDDEFAALSVEEQGRLLESAG